MPLYSYTLETEEKKKPSPQKISEWEQRIAWDAAKLVKKSFDLAWDAEEKCITIGQQKFAKFVHYKTYDAFCNHILDLEAVYAPTYHPKWRNKWLAACLKGNPKQIFDHFNKMQYKFFVMPVLDILVKTDFRRGRIAANTLNQIRKHEAVCREVFDDGLYNILPFVVAAGKSPQELRKEYGPTWKMLANNSLHRNKALLVHVGIIDWTYSHEPRKNKLVERASLPTTVLKYFKGYPQGFLEHIAAHYKGKWNIKVKLSPPEAGKLSKVLNPLPDWSSVLHTVRDTERMAEQLGKPFSAVWTPRKMKEKHDQYSKEINLLKYSPEPIEWMEEICQRFEHEGFVATLLNSRYRIADEGTHMGHCVGSYAENVANGSYLVYSVANAEGERSSTLGILVSSAGSRCWDSERNLVKQSNSRSFTFSQHHGRFNAHLKNVAEIELGKMVVKQLNNIEKEKQK